MKQKKLENIIAKGIKELAKLTDAKERNTEAYHKFRLSYKKLRAALRMYHGLTNAKLLPAAINKVYKSTGIIRDFQLHIDFLTKSIRTSLPEVYISKLRKEIDKEDKKLGKLLKDIDVKKLERKIISHLPHGVKDKDVQHWQDNQYISIDRLKTTLDNDETIHDIRKRVKDISYTAAHVDSKKEAKKKDAELKSLATALGNQHDLSVQIGMIEKFIKKAPAGEHPILLKTAKKWNAQKMRLTKKINLRLQAQ